MVGDLDLNEMLDEGRLLAWAMSQNLRRELERHLRLGGAPMPFAARLRREAAHLEVTVDDEGAEVMVEAVDRFSRAHVEFQE